VVFRPIPDDWVRIAALQAGEVDLAVNVPSQLAAIVEHHPRLRLRSVASGRTIQLMLYTHRMDAQHRPIGPYPGPTADRRVRRAMALALDVDAIIRSILGGWAVRLASPLTDRHFGFDPGLAPLQGDLATARRLLGEAGFPGGIDLVLNAPSGRYAHDKEVAEALAGQWSRAGIRTTVRIHEWGAYLSRLVYVHQAGPVWLSGWGAGAFDAETVYVPLFRTGGFLVNSHAPELDRLLDAALTTMDETARLALYRRITRRWLEELPAIALYRPVDLYGVSRRLDW
jgi:peptide/nickel transport system substrate-binding protein